MRPGGSVSVFIALLRAVNVGGTGKLPMADLVRMAGKLGFREPRTYIASGNLVFEWEGSAGDVKSKLERALAEYAGKEVGVLVRTAAELAAVLEANPFAGKPPNRTMVIFLDSAPPTDVSEGVVGPAGEEVRTGRRELYVYYPEGMGRSRLTVPGAKRGTARNINTVQKLVQLSSPRE